VIDLSWIKKILGKVIDNEKHSEEEVVEDRKIETQRRGDSDIKQREVEARMAYHYPKENFRFPLISDNDAASNERIRRPRRREKEEEKTKLTQKQPSQPVSKQTGWKESKQPVPKKESRHTRPFQPTEIPSPIYGFQNRPRKEEETELELKQISQNEEYDKSHLEVNGTSNTSNSIYDYEAVKEEPDPPIMTIEKEQIEENNNLHENAAETNFNENTRNSSYSAINQKDDEVSPANEGDQPPTYSSSASHKELNPIISIKEGRYGNTDQLINEDAVEEEKVDLIQMEEDAAEEEKVDLIQMEEDAVEEEKVDLIQMEEDAAEEEKVDLIQMEEDAAEEEKVDLIQMEEDAVEEEKVDLIQVEEDAVEEEKVDLIQMEEDAAEEEKVDLIQMEEDAAEEEKVNLGQIEADLTKDEKSEPDRIEIEEASVGHDKTKMEEGQNATISEPAVEKSPEVSKPARSHLPFNVLMLKQDKRKVQNNARQSRMETRQQRETKIEEKSVLREENTVFSEQKEPVESSEVQGKKATESYNQFAQSAKKKEGYAFPSMEILSPPVSKQMSNEWLENRKQLLNETLLNFNVRASVVNVTQGPSVTRFEVQPEPGVKVNKITNLSDDIKLSLAAKDIRIEAPIPGKHTIGIEVPNKESRPVCISEVISSPAFQEHTSPLTAALGLDISGAPIVTDLSKMPHGLIAGATGSGKSVCINSILVSLLYKATPDELKLLLIDPKMVELAPYNRIPHLVSPVITDVKAATAALKWAVEEMERRYELFAHTGCRDIKRFNELAKRNNQHSDVLPYLVIVIDELADLMMMSPADVEEAICRIAQKARACGIHLIIATQRPSVDVITGLIKANVPTRVAFSVSSQVDSRTIIDSGGAERLLGKGDMLFLENGSSKPVRLQGTFVSDDEIDDIIEFVRDQAEPNYLFQQDELIKKAQITEEEDELFYEVCEFVVDQGGASTSALQRRFRIGYNRAARLMGLMEEQGIISEQRGTKPRDVLISEADLGAIQETSTIM
jgi:DNA segregation ATPase FtsK/SpoIIIE, S-DNA-T family